MKNRMQTIDERVAFEDRVAVEVQMLEGTAAWLLMDGCNDAAAGQLMDIAEALRPLIGDEVPARDRLG